MVGELHLALAGEFAAAFQARDAVGLEQQFHAAGELLADLVLAALHGAQVELGVLGGDAVRRELMLGAMEQFGGLQQRLGGNTAGIQTGTAERGAVITIHPFVDADRGKTQLRCAYGCRIAGRAATDHDDVVGITHLYPRSVSRHSSLKQS